MNLPLPLFLASVAARTLLVLLVVTIGIRLSGSRNMSDVDMVDILMVLLLGNAIQNAITYGSGDLGVGLVTATTLLVADRLLGFLFIKKPQVEKSLFGDPLIIVENGKADHQLMQKKGVTDEELSGAVHAEGLDDIGQVRLGVLEPDGTISIVPKEHE